MDVMRLDYYRNDPAGAHRNPDRVFQNVRFLKVHGDWALTYVLPVNSAGKGIAEPRWGLLHRKAGRWTHVDYFDAIGPYSSEESADEALDMATPAIRKIWRVFPDAPKDIFPALSKRKP